MQHPAFRLAARFVLSTGLLVLVACASRPPAAATSEADTQADADAGALDGVAPGNDTAGADAHDVVAGSDAAQDADAKGDADTAETDDAQTDDAATLDLLPQGDAAPDVPLLGDGENSGDAQSDAGSDAGPEVLADVAPDVAPDAGLDATGDLVADLQPGTDVVIPPDDVVTPPDDVVTPDDGVDATDLVDTFDAIVPDSAVPDDTAVIPDGILDDAEGTDAAIADLQIEDVAATDVLADDTPLDTGVDTADVDTYISPWLKTCFVCHGDESRDDPAPPYDLEMHTDTQFPGVGAHQSHLQPATWRHDITCDECHPVPNPYAPTHHNNQVDFAWGPIAKQGTFDKTTLQCSGSYCHGGTLTAADPVGVTSNKTPTWNVVDGSQEACGVACHAVPPGGKHPGDSACQNCHGEVIASFDPATQKATWKNKNLHIDGLLEVGNLNCTSCHGDAAANNPAPPKGSKGETLTNEAAVGAHTAHLAGGAWHQQVLCTDCHVLPDSTAHANGVLDLTFSALASASGANPQFDPGTITCSNTYCHGVTLGNPKVGGVVKHEPIWNQVDGSFAKCGASCHTNPPAEPHAQSDNCAQCHGEVIASYDGAQSTATWANAALHIDGKIEVIGLTCTSCHGDALANDPAPPRGTKGEMLPTQAAVGAHQKHLKGSDWHRQGECADCHTVPQSTSHTNGQVDFNFGAVASADGAQPSFDSQSLTCATAYCHGPTLKQGAKAGGTLKQTPVWTQNDGTFESCGASCHTNPPGGKHPVNDKCEQCHSEVIASYDTATFVAVWKNAAMHINGNVDVFGLSCTSCHGDAASNNPAPPKGSKGETLTTQPAVGAHAQHLTPSAWHRDGQCTDCHTVPASVGHANGQIDFSWGDVATTGGSLPVFDLATTTCASVYCHGETLPAAKTGGQTKKQPVWTQVDGTFDSCGASCHTNPPGGTHPQNANCALCHTPVISAFDANTQTATWAAPALHIDGTVEMAVLTCTTCHGDAATNTPAPPKGTQGETLTTQPAVGSHAQHLGASTWHRGGECADCHTVPTSTTHTDGLVELTWGAVATAANSTPSFDVSTVTCNAVYCHGNTLPAANLGGTTKRTPVWTQADGTFDSCGASCHTNPPGGNHPVSTACEMCHTEVIANYNPATKQATWNSPGLHIDGQVQVKTLTCTTCHGDAGTNDPAPPLGTHGEQLTTSAAVGAHQNHLQASQWHRQGQCTDCHTVPTSVTHSNGATDLNFAGPSTSGGAQPSFDASSVTCSSVYCHGTTLFGPKPGVTLKQQPVWNQVDGTYDACGASCHSTPPGGPHVQSAHCEQCHGEVIQSFVPGANGAAPTVVWKDASRHVNGIIDAPALTCTACHGDAASNNPAPPLGTKGETATSEPAVGAHANHLGASAWHRDVQCTDCHKVPAQTLHSNGVDDIDFGAIAATGGTLPQFDSATVTCNAVYCHGATLPAANVGGTTHKSPVWTQVDGTFNSCGASCHTNPPGGTHPQNSTQCQMCHTEVIQSYDAATKTAVWVDKAKHIDGVVEVKTLTCTTCHGNAANDDPSPPLGTQGETLTSQAAVGAHQKHLAASTWHRDGACIDCHTVPQSTAHSNGTVDMTWGSVAKAAGATPSFDANTVTCATVYCHGTTLAGAKAGGTIATTPVWTAVNGSYEACGASCHTNPPGGSHPQSTNCATCHTAVIQSYDPATSTAVWQDKSLHVNGILEVKTLTCTTCHGDAASNNPAPPLGTKGETLTSQAAVGAHGQHLNTSTWHRQVQCEDCHVVPTSTNHSNGVFDFGWAGPSAVNGAKPSFDAATVTCSSVYCHGNTLPFGAAPGGTLKLSPVWTTVDGTYDSCGQSCHTTPPATPHVQNNNCEQCHGAVISKFTPGVSGAPPTVVWNDFTRHIDGIIDAPTLSCTACHGTAATNDPAPPKGTKGETLTTQPAVGAHQQHLASSTWHRDVQCSDCHVVPASSLHSNGVDDVDFGAIAATGGTTPAWDSTAVTCNAVYCHGATLPAANAGGTTKKSPVWTTVNGTFDSCGASCHTNPPGGTHPASTACANCHTDVIQSYDPNQKTAVWNDRALHIDGKVEVKALTCTSCHGNAATADPAPPLGTNGETLTSQAAVGAHQNHLAASGWHRDVLCNDCHTVPTSMTHTNGILDIVWGTVATASGAAPTFDSATLTCNAVYCHGTTLPAANAGGATQKSPVWTTVNGTYQACGASCHTNPPGGTHPQSTACASCHGQVIASYDPATKTAVWADKSLHVDGVTQVKPLTCTSCHGDAASNNPAPPTGTQGETLTSQAAVGAHQQHLSASTWHRQVECADCHVVPASTSHSNGVFDFAWGGPAAVNGATPAFDTASATCSGVYCHGNTLPFGANATGTLKLSPVWTKVDGTYDSCGQSCHTTPPGLPHVQNNNCQDCHGAVIAAFAPGVGNNPPTVVWNDATRHIDGIIDAPTLTCTACHGDAPSNNPAPPKGTKGETLTTQAAVGAHQQHLNTSTWHRDGQCVDCHTVPAQPLHANGVDDINFGTVATSGGAAPVFSASDVSCNAVYCHGTTLPGANASGTIKQTPIWTTVDGSFDTCGQACHSIPVGGTHVAHTDCSICHSAVVATFDPATKATTWKDRTLHIDGVVQSNKYHNLPNWTTPKFGTPANPNHHGSVYFIRNQMRDEHNIACTTCHGADYNGGTVNVSCNNATVACHGANSPANGTGGDWKACNFCHGSATQNNPPTGVANETANTTLGVGKHAQHLAASATHVAFTCINCHVIPGAGDIAHIAQYVYSADLTTAGHHGDVTIPAPPVVLGATTSAMAWDVNATTGTGPTGRGTCLGNCHSSGRTGTAAVQAPLVTPYWAGTGTTAWTVASCAMCHAATPTSGTHSTHTKSSNNVGCTGCHPGAATATHLNGLRDVNATCSSTSYTGSVVPSRNATTGRVSCNGTCHGQNHAPKNW